MRKHVAIILKKKMSKVHNMVGSSCVKLKKIKKMLTNIMMNSLNLSCQS